MGNRICSVEGCRRDWHCKDFCKMHYQRNARYGHPTQKTVASNKGMICNVDGCDAVCRSLGMCGKHVQRWRKYGSTDLPSRVQRRCDGPECDRFAGTSGLCPSHQSQRRQGRQLTPLQPIRTGCDFPDCDKPHEARGLCHMHYAQQLRGIELRAIRFLIGDCAFEGCERRNEAAGWCTKHYRNLLMRWQRYGITEEQGQRHYADQDGACAICKTPSPIWDLHIDHDHAYCPGQKGCGNCVRGLLCKDCNLGIGRLHDDVVRLQSAISYLTPTTQHALADQEDPGH